MGLSFKSNMTILEILEGTDKVILANIDLLAKDYFEKKGRRLNKGCSSCVTEMVLTLKNIYKMVQFKFKRHAASYKDKKGDTSTISNSTMTDEKALKFLKTDPKRIHLFSDFPSNWKQLIKGKIETEAEMKIRLASEAEAIEAAKEAALNANKELIEETVETEEEKEIRLTAEKAASEGSGSGESPAEKEAREAAEKAVEDSKKPSREELMKMKMKDLRTKYPEITATSIKDFVDKILA